jgi:BNR repeat-like domain
MKRFSIILALIAGCARSAGPTFHAAEVLSVGDAGTAPMFAVSSSGKEAVAWVSAPNGGTDGRLNVSIDGDAPVVIRDSLGPIEPRGESPPKLAYSPDGSLSALYVVTRLVPGGRFPASALRFVHSADGGAHWSAPMTVTDDSLFASHDFQALSAAPDGVLYASWLDGRLGKPTVYMTFSTDGGQHWMKNIRVMTGEACSCCRTAIAEAPNGGLYIAWREVFPGNVRDIVVARSPNRGFTWEDPVRVHADNWVFDGCPQAGAGPSLQADGKGAVHIAWWTGKQGSAGVWYARSDDGALSFSVPIPLGVAEFSRPAHVQLALGGQEGRLIAAWDDGTLATPRIVVRTSKDRGAHWSEPATLSDPQGARAAGFPVVAASRDRVAVAWSEQSLAASHDAHADTNDPHATIPLSSVGDARVVVRRGTLP